MGRDQVGQTDEAVGLGTCGRLHCVDRGDDARPRAHRPRDLPFHEIALAVARVLDHCDAGHLVEPDQAPGTGCQASPQYPLQRVFGTVDSRLDNRHKPPSGTPVFAHHQIRRGHDRVFPVDVNLSIRGRARGRLQNDLVRPPVVKCADHVPWSPRHETRCAGRFALDSQSSEDSPDSRSVVRRKMSPDHAGPACSTTSPVSASLRLALIRRLFRYWNPTISA